MKLKSSQRHDLDSATSLSEDVKKRQEKTLAENYANSCPVKKHEN